jgi:hypothetical protein
MMSTYVDLHGDPDDVTSTGARLKAAAESFGAQAKEILNEIQSIDTGAPWGSDEPGQAFASQYHQTPQGGGPPFSESLQTEMSSAGEHLGKAGDAIMLAMSGYQSTDITNTNDIKNVEKT